MRQQAQLEADLGKCLTWLPKAIMRAHRQDAERVAMPGEAQTIILYFHPHAIVLDFEDRGGDSSETSSSVHKRSLEKQYIVIPRDWR